MNECVENSRCSQEGCPQTECYSKEALRYEINIQPLDIGYALRVGCQSIAISDVKSLLLNLNDYILDPKKWQDKWSNGDKTIL